MTRRRAASFTAFVRGALGVTLTPAQRVLYAVGCDGVQPASLPPADRELALRLFGDVAEVPALAREVLVQVKGARVGGTRFGALRLLHLALTHPLADTIAPGEEAVALIVGPDVRLARQALRFALGAARAVPAIARRIRNRTADRFVLLREDGRRVRIECLPATRGGSALRGRSLVAALLTECAFFRDSEYLINDTELFRAIAPRILPGGQTIVESTPWAEAGLVYDLFSKNHGAPTTALAAHCATLLMRPDERTRRIVDAERERDPDNAAREFDAEFMSAGAGLFFDPRAIDACVQAGRALPIAVPAGAVVGAGADFAFRSDSSAMAVAAKGRDGIIDLVALEEMRPTKGSPLKPSAVVARFAQVARENHVAKVVADRHYEESIREHLDEHALRLATAPDGSDGKATVYLEARKLINEKRLRLPDDRRLIAQLKAVIAKPTSGGGLTISSPRRRGGGHGDLVSALVLALWQLAKRSTQNVATSGGFFPGIPFEDRPLGFSENAGGGAWGGYGQSAHLNHVATEITRAALARRR